MCYSLYMLDHLTLLCSTAWSQASPAERAALRHAAGLPESAEPTDVFTTIAKLAPTIDPTLCAHLYPELNVTRKVNRMELGSLTLSPESTLALEMALAYELGLRIDRVLADLPSTDDLTQEELEASAKAQRVT